MLTKVLVVAAALLPLACSGGALEADAGSSRGGALDGGTDAGLGGAGGQSGDDLLIYPPGLDVELEPGGYGVFSLYALTLRDGPDGLELYAALNNVGDVPGCDAAFKVTINDKNGQPLGDFINGLDTSHLYVYTLPDGSTTIAACASPGDVAMTNIFTMAPDITVADVGSVVYYYSYFDLDAVLIDNGLSVGSVNSVTGSAGTSYTGTVTNGLNMPVSDPSVRIFPLNSVGRPLGVASAGDSSQIPAGGTWTFQTDGVDMPGVNYAAFAAATFSN